MRGVVVGVLCVVLGCVSGCSVVGSLGVPGFGGVELLECDLPDGVSSEASPSSSPTSSSSSTATVSPSPTSSSSLGEAWGEVVGGVGDVVGARGVLDGGVDSLTDEELGELVFGGGTQSGDVAAALEGFDASSVFLGRVAGVVVGRAGSGVDVDRDVAQVVLARTGVVGSFSAWRGVGDVGAVVDGLGVRDEVVARSLACALRGELASGAGRGLLDVVGLFYGERGVPLGARVWCERWLVWRVGDVFVSWMGESGGVFDGFVRVGLVSLVSEEGRVGFVRGVRGVVHERLWALEFKEGASVEGQVADVGRGVGVVVAMLTRVDGVKDITPEEVASSVLSLDSHAYLELGRTSWEREEMVHLPGVDHSCVAEDSYWDSRAAVRVLALVAWVASDQPHAADLFDRRFVEERRKVREAKKVGSDRDVDSIFRLYGYSQDVTEGSAFARRYGRVDSSTRKAVKGGRLSVAALTDNEPTCEVDDDYP